MASEEERDNFFHLTLLLFRNGNQRLREYFKTQWLTVYQRVKPGAVPPPWQDTPADATEMKNIQPTKLKFKFQDEKTKFDSGNTNDWDFSLLTTVLRSSSLHFVLPSSPECKALDDLKDIRNKLIGHATDAAIPNGVFNTEWTKACNALKLFNATAADFKAVQDDVKKPLDVLYPMLKQCIRQEKEIQYAVDTIFTKLEQLHQGQERLLQDQASLQHGQERMIQGQASLQQGQERMIQGQASLQQGQTTLMDKIQDIQSKILAVLIIVAGCILYGQYKDDQAALVCGLITTCLLTFLWYLINLAFMFAYIRYCSKALKSSIKGCSEYLPKIMTSHQITSARTDDIFTNLMVYCDRKQIEQGQVEDLSRSEQLQEYSKRFVHRVKEYIDIFIDTVRKNPKRILLTGKPGVGKSLLCLKITRDWAFNNFRIDLKFVYLLTFRQLEALGDKELNFRELLNCSALLDEHSVIDDSLLEYLMKNPSKVLFILDGYDEYSRQHRKIISNDNLEQKYSNNPREKMPVPALCSKLIRGKIFRDSVVFISSRPGEATEELGKIHFDRYVEVAGFSSEQVTEFVEKYFSKPEEEETKKTIREHIEKNENLVSFCHIPLLCLLLCWCLEWRICQSGNTENLPAKITDIYDEVVQVSLEKLHAKLKYTEMTETVKSFAQETLIKLEQLSGYLLKQKKYIFTEGDMKESNLTQDDIENLKISGILHCLPVVKISAFEVKNEYSFSHLTFMEYFSACLFVKNKEVPDTKETSGQTLVFMSGLLSKEKDEQLMNELMEGIKYDRVNKLLTLQCLYEYGDDELSKLTINNLHDKYCDSNGLIAFGGITDVTVQCLSYLLNIIHLLLQERQVQSFSHVHTLAIVGSFLTSYGVGVVCKSLVHHSYITVLVLAGCRLDDNSVEAITNSLLNTKITQLDLRSNSITNKGAESILSALLHDNCCVKWLSLQYNEEITEECKERFRRLVREKKPHFNLCF